MENLRARHALAMLCVALGLALFGAASAMGAELASIVVDARNGAVLHADDADRRQQPASLTKMMTLYLTFEAVRDGKLGLDQRVPVSRHAARMPRSKMGLKPGEKVAVRDLIRAAAVRSANDAAVVLAEAIAGSEKRFAEVMTRRARELGMRSTTFRNASGLTASGHLSTARDMATLGRHLLFDFPQYYNIFGRKNTVAMGRRINNTNRLLSSFRGADGIKTGYTRAAGFNLVASAKRGPRRVIAVLLGGQSSRSRDAAVARLLEKGLAASPVRVAVVPPGDTVRLAARGGPLVAPQPVPRPGGAGGIGTLIASLELPENTVVTGYDESTEEPDEADDTYAEGSEGPDDSGLVSAMPAPAPNRSAADLATGWAVELGSFPLREHALAELARADRPDLPALATANRTVTERARGSADRYTAMVTGLDGLTALTTCAVLTAEGRTCRPVAPEMQ